MLNQERQTNGMMPNDCGGKNGARQSLIISPMRTLTGEEISSVSFVLNIFWPHICVRALYQNLAAPANLTCDHIICLRYRVIFLIDEFTSLMVLPKRPFKF